MVTTYFNFSFNKKDNFRQVNLVRFFKIKHNVLHRSFHTNRNLVLKRQKIVALICTILSSYLTTLISKYSDFFLVVL